MGPSRLEKKRALEQKIPPTTNTKLKLDHSYGFVDYSTSVIHCIVILTFLVSKRP